MVIDPIVNPKWQSVYFFISYKDGDVVWKDFIVCFSCLNFWTILIVIIPL